MHRWGMTRQPRELESRHRNRNCLTLPIEVEKVGRDSAAVSGTNAKIAVNVDSCDCAGVVFSNCVVDASGRFHLLKS